MIRDCFKIKGIKKCDRLESFMEEKGLLHKLKPISLMRKNGTVKPSPYEFYFCFEDVITPEIAELFKALKVGIKKANIQKGEYFSK